MCIFKNDLKFLSGHLRSSKNKFKRSFGANKFLFRSKINDLHNACKRKVQVNYNIGIQYLALQIVYRDAKQLNRVAMSR